MASKAKTSAWRITTSNQAFGATRVQGKNGRISANACSRQTSSSSGCRSGWATQSSIAKRVLERLDAFLDETDDAKRMPAAGKVAVVAVVGNEDGAHHCHAASFKALNDVGFTIPPMPGLTGLARP